MQKVTLGGERLGSGKKNKIEMHGYGRSSFNLDKIFRTTMSAGTLVPFMVEIALPGDTHDIDLDAYVMTHPTIGPMFGSYKVQLDVFTIPYRLFQGKLHMNLNNVGRQMESLRLPLIEIVAPAIDWSKDADNQQINPSSIFAYLGIRGVGAQADPTQYVLARKFDATPYLGYFEIFKNYYANKQEDIAYIVHREPLATVLLISATGTDIDGTYALPLVIGVDPAQALFSTPEMYINLYFDNTDGDIEAENVKISYNVDGGGTATGIFTNLFANIEYFYNEGRIKGSVPKGAFTNQFLEILGIVYDSTEPIVNPEPKLVPFPLQNIDVMRLNILGEAISPDPYPINYGSIEPYNLPLQFVNDGSGISGVHTSPTKNQEGLLVKTYQSDKFNNWINTEWIDGADGISEITKVSTVGDSFTIDELNLKTKVYKMLSRIAMSDGTYNQWKEVVYDISDVEKTEIPVYEGGLIKELIFDEVVSTSSIESERAPQQPLGTLAGRGKLAQKHKGGSMTIKTREHCVIMGIVSITPRIDYSQGNMWHTVLQSMNDFHKPQLDEIGFQDLVTDEFAYYDTKLNTDGTIIYKSAGKVPAWQDYMTSYNRCLGNFAIKEDQMWMTLNRRYGQSESVGITDVTTYIDPVKFNYIFANTRRDAQNFWMQIGVDHRARRVMSSKVMPNL